MAYDGAALPMSDAPEKQAREKIDALLTACGWAVQNYVVVDFTACAVGRPFAQLVLTALSSNRLTSVDAARYLGLRFEHIDELRQQITDPSISVPRSLY